MTKKFIFLKIITLLGALYGFIAARNYGTEAVSETIGFAIPFAVIGAVLGAIVEGVVHLIRKKKVEEDEAP
jgi:hypothetical protein